MDIQKANLFFQLISKRYVSGLLAAPERATPHAERDANLYCYSMMLYADASFLAQLQAIRARTDLTAEGEEAAISKLRPDLSKRSAIRAIDDGRYKFARYFSLKQHNTPKSMAELVKYNDLELFDLQNDPDEIHNLALDLKRNGELVMAMNEKLNALIAQELGVDDGSYLPPGELGGWKAGHVASE